MLHGPPGLRRSEAHRRAAEDKAVDTLRQVARERHADGAAERETAEVDAVEAELVEERRELVGEALDARTLGRCRTAVSRVVVTKDAEVMGESGHLRIPHRERRAERAGQHDHGVVLAVHPVVEAHASR